MRLISWDLVSWSLMRILISCGNSRENPHLAKSHETRLRLWLLSTNQRQTEKLKTVTVFFSFAHRLKCICGKKKWFLSTAGRHWIGGEMGEQWGRNKNGFGTTPYFLVIADDQEGWEAFSSVIILSRFLDWLLTICEEQKIFCTWQEIRSSLVNFSFLDSALKSRSFHIIIQTLVPSDAQYYTLILLRPRSKWTIRPKNESGK